MSDGFMKTAIGVGALAVGYYYALYLPGKDAEAKAAVEEAALAASMAAEASRSAEREERERRQTAFVTCKTDAYARYSNRWDASCARLHEADMKARNACEANGYDASYCVQAFPVRPAKDCSLPNEMSEDYDAAHKEERELCLAASKEGLEL